MSFWEHVEKDIWDAVPGFIKGGLEFGKDVADAATQALETANNKQGTKRNRGNDEESHVKRFRPGTSSEDRDDMTDTESVSSKSTTNTAHRSINTGDHGVKSMSRGATDGNEIAVVPAPKLISKTIPDYTTIELTWFGVLYQANSVAGGMDDTTINMNDIQNPLGAGTVFAAVQSQNSDHQPLGHDHWAATYKYYRVLQSDINMHFINTTGGIDNATSNLERHLLVGYEITDDPAQVYTDMNTWVEGKHSKAAPMLNNGYGYGQDLKMSFHYDPMNWDYHVHETGIEERWTPTNTAPSNPHYLILRTAALSNDFYSCQILLHIKFRVQWRELQLGKHKTQDADPV